MGDIISLAAVRDLRVPPREIVRDSMFNPYADPMARPRNFMEETAEPAPQAKPERRPECQESFRLDLDALKWVVANLATNDAAALVVLNRGRGQSGSAPDLSTWGPSAISRNSGMSRAAGVTAMNRLRRARVIVDADPVAGWDAVRLVAASPNATMIEVCTGIWRHLDDARTTRDPLAVLSMVLAHRIEPEAIPTFPAAAKM